MISLIDTILIIAIILEGLFYKINLKDTIKDQNPRYTFLNNINISSFLLVLASLTTLHLHTLNKLNPTTFTLSCILSIIPIAYLINVVIKSNIHEKIPKIKIPTPKPKTKQKPKNVINKQETKNKTIKTEKQNNIKDLKSNIDISIQNKKAITLIKEKQYNEALKILNNIIEIEPTNIEALNNRGYIYDITKNPNEAINDYNKIMKIDPQNTITLTNLSRAYYDNQDYEKSLQAINQIIQMKKDTVETHLNKLYVLFSTKDIESIRDELNLIKTTYPNNENIPKFETKLKKLQSNNDRETSNTINELQQQANDYYEKKKYRNALLTLQNITKIDPDNIAAWTLMKQIYEKYESPEKVKECKSNIIRIEKSR